MWFIITLISSNINHKLYLNGVCEKCMDFFKTPLCEWLSVLFREKTSLCTLIEATVLGKVI